MNQKAAAELTANNIGLAAEVFVGQSTTDGALRRAAQRAVHGQYCAGEKGYFRHRVAEGMEAILTQRRSTILEMDDMLPHIRFGLGETTMAGEDLGTMLIEESRQGRITRYLEPVRAPLTDSTRQLADMTLAELRRTKAYEAGRHQEVAQLLLETAALIRTSICHIVTKERSAQSPAYIGLISYAGNNVADSALALMLRKLLAEGPALGLSIAAVTKQPFIKLYTLQAALRALVQQVLVAREILREGMEDALAAASLQASAAELAALEWRESLATRPQADHALVALVTERSLGSLGYLLHADGERELGRLERPDQPHDAQFAVIGHTPCVTAPCLYAGLPEGECVAAAVAQTMAGMRGEMDAILRRLPLVRANLGQLGRLEFQTIYNDPDSFEISADAEMVEILHGLMPADRRRQPEPCDQEQPDEPEPPEADDQEEQLVQARQLPFGKFDHFLQTLGMHKLSDGGKGSHTKYRNPLSGRFCTISYRYSHSHTRPVPRGIVKASLSDLALTPEQVDQANHLLAAIH